MAKPFWQACALHLHGYTERVDPRATFSSPTAIGLMVAVGNVGKSLAPYVDSDTFLTRNGGFSWEEVHKDAHMWEFGDQGSILVLVNDEGPTDHVTYTLDEGLTWQEYSFGEKLRIRSIFTVPQDTSRKFILFGYSPQKQDESVAVHLDFSKLTNRKCNLDLSDPDNDDFEVWSPSEERQEKCLFGKQTMYHRRIRGRSCYIGEELKPFKEEKVCECSEDDFEWCVPSIFSPLRLLLTRICLSVASLTMSATRKANAFLSTEPDPWHLKRCARGATRTGTSAQPTARALTPSAKAARG